MVQIRIPPDVTSTAVIDADYKVVADATARGLVTHEDGKRVWQQNTSQLFVSDGTNWTLINGTAIAPSDTYYVSTTGNDSTGNGSESQPWASLTKAITEANANSTAINPIVIRLEPGAYTEDNSAGALTVTAAGVTIQGSSTSSCLIAPNTVGNNLLAVSGDSFTLENVTLTGVTGAACLSMSGTGLTQRLIAVTFNGSQDGIVTTNTGTVIMEACITNALTGIGIDIQAGEVVGGDLALLGSANPVSPVGTGVRVGASGSYLADTVRVFAHAVGVETTGTTVLYSHDFLINDVGVDIKASSNKTYVNGSTLRETNTTAISAAAATFIVAGTQFDQTSLGGKAIVCTGTTRGIVTGCDISNFTSGVEAGSASDVEIKTTSFRSNTTDLTQVDTASTVLSLGNSYTSTKISLADSDNFTENSFLVDLSRQRATGSTELVGIQVYSIEDVDPTAEAGKVLQYAKNSTDPTNTELMLHFNGGNGSTTFTDSSANSKTVTANGDVQQSTTVLKYGVSTGLFDGAGDYLTVSDKTGISWATDFTIEAWVYTSGFANNNCLFENLTDASNLIRVDSSSGNLRAQVIDGGTTVATITGNAVANNVWQHVAFVREGNDYSLYLDGVLQGSTNSAAGTTATFTSALAVGARSSATNFYDGYMDEFRISSEARYSGSFNKPVTPFDTPVLFNRLPDGSIIPTGGV